MEPSEYIKNAVLCVKELLKNNVRDDLLFNDAQNASLAATLSAVSHCASYVQDTVCRSPNLHNIEIVIACYVNKASSNHSRTRQKKFHLWKATKPLTIDNPTTSLLTQQLPSASPMENKFSTLHEDGNIPRAISSGNPMDRLSADHPSRDVKYSVPVAVAANCLQLLLDGSGSSSHQTCIQRKTFSELGSKPLIEVVQKLFEAEKRTRSNGEGEDLKTTPNKQETSSQSMIYRDLLPDHLRHVDLNEAVSIIVPDVRIEYNGAPKVSKLMNVTLKIRKPNRNKKEQNYALLCAVMHFTGSTGTCAEVMRTYARLGEKGCTRRMRFCTGPSSNCGGFDKCKYAKRSICSFYKFREDPPVGKGKVDPHCEQINSQTIPEGRIAVRFSVVNETVMEVSNGNREPHFNEENVTAWLKQPVIWKKSLVGRVKILGGYDVVGSAILVEDRIPDRLQKSVARHTKGKLNFGNAVIICDFQLDESFKHGEITYPFAEWYNVSCLRYLTATHFLDGKPPFHLNENTLQSTVALLWHKDKYKEMGE